LASALLAPAGAAAQAAGSTAPVLTASNPSASGSLNSSGSWQLFLQHPGKNQVIVIVLDVDNSGRQMGQGLSFDVWRVRDGAWVARGMAVQNDPNRTKAFAPVRSSQANGDTFLISVNNYGSGHVNATVSTVWDAIGGNPNSAAAPVFNDKGLLVCPTSSATPDTCKVADDGAGRWMAGSIAGGTQVAPKQQYYLISYPGAFVPLTTTLVMSNSNRSLNLNPGGNTNSGSASSTFSFNLYGTGTSTSLGIPKILACLGSGQEISWWGPGNRAAQPGTPVQCQTTEGTSGLQASPYGAIAAPFLPASASVVTYTGRSPAGFLGLELANYGSTSSSGNRDYAIYVEFANKVEKRVV